MKIGQYLAKIWTRVRVQLFFETRCMIDLLRTDLAKL